MQIKICFHGVTQVENLWVSYEPVWSIGVGGTPASAEYAEQMHGVIKQTLLELFGDVGDNIPILYGGSVNPDNAEQLIRQPTIDGLFVGRAAWDADKFSTLIRAAKRAREVQFAT